MFKSQISGYFHPWYPDLCLGFLLLGLLVMPAQGGVVAFTEQSRSVEVTTSGVPFLPDYLNANPQTQQASAPDFGPFDKSVDLIFSSIGTGETASQQSTLTLTPDGLGARIDASGLLITPASSNGLNGSSKLDVTFTLSQPEPYLLTYNGRQGDPRSPTSDQFVSGFFGGPSAPGVLVGDPHTTNFLSVLTYSGTLQPGTYDLMTQSQTIGNASFDVHLAVGTAAVPVPAAFWQVLTALPILSSGMWLFARNLPRIQKSR